MVRSRSFSPICPWATAIRASGTVFRRRLAMEAMLSTRLWTK